MVSVVPGHAQMRLKSGSYVGDGLASQAVTNLGFTPDLVIIKADDFNPTVARTSTMIGDASKELVSLTAIESGLIQSLDADGFTVGTDSRVNSFGVTYYWTAFEEFPGELKLGTYSGDGNDNRSVPGVGFQARLCAALQR